MWEQSRRNIWSNGWEISKINAKRVLDMTPKTLAQNNKQISLTIKAENFVYQKTLPRKWKDSLQNGRLFAALLIPDKDFPMAQIGKNPHAMWETWVWSLGWEDPLEESMATHFSILDGESPWTEEPGGLQSMELQRVRHDWATKHIPDKD